MRRDGVVEAAEHAPPIGAALGEAFDRWMAALPSFLRIPEQLDGLEPMLRTMERRLTAQVLEVEQIHREIERQNEALEALCSRQDLLEHASRQQAQLTDQHYRDHVIAPVARQLLPLIDLADDVLVSRKAKNGNGSVDSLLRAIRSHLLDALIRLGIESYGCTPGSAFDPKHMRPLRTEPTQECHQDRTVAAQLRSGFRVDQQILRPAGVAVYRYAPAVVATHGNGGTTK